jgi:hypothetical protein
MKYIYLIYATTLFALSACQQPSKSPNNTTTNTPTPKPILDPAKDGEAVKAALTTILTHAQMGDCESMAPLLAYKTGNSPDTWHRGLRYDVEPEKLEAEKECAKLQVLVTGMQQYIFTEFATEQEQEGEWLIWKVKLQYQGGESAEKAFAFLEVADGYILGDID